MILIDTDILIEIFDKKSELGERAFDKIRDADEPFCITTITLHEILYGLMKYAKPMGEILNLPIISYDKKDAELSAKLELKAESKGRKTLRMDAMIAAIAMNADAKLYTNNPKHFEVFEELNLF